MTKQVRQTETSGMVKAVKVADYIVERLAAEGINHCFGVAGDYVFPICDAVDSSAKVKWIGCANELNASYAADGYARIRSAAMLVTTYGVGELSALNGVMGAKAERSLVFHVAGMPSYQHQRVRKITHHTLGDGVFGNFVDLSAAAGCCHAVINPENCIVEMERVIAAARRNNQPTYIAVPSDYALSPVVSADVKPIAFRSDQAALQKAMAIIAQRINNAKSVVAFPAFTILRLGLQKQVQEAIETGSTSSGVTLMMLADGVRVEAQVLWGSIGWATPAAFGIALSDPDRRTVLITGEGSHQLTANDIGAMGRFGANVIVFVLNNSGYLIERALEENPNWTYNDLASWNYTELPKALGCADWYTARVTTLGELDEAMKAARASKTGAYIEIIGGKMDMPPALAYAHDRLKAMYGDTP